MNNQSPGFSWWKDAAVPVFLVIGFTLQPYFMHGKFDFIETGACIPFINELFHHKILFRDFIIFRGPLEIYVPAALMALFGKHITVFHAWMYFSNVSTLVAAVLLARELLRTRLFRYLLIPVMVANTFSLVFYRTWGGFRYASGLLAILCAVRFLKCRGTGFAYLFWAGCLSAGSFFFSADIGMSAAFSILAALIVFNKEIRLYTKIAWYLAGVAGVAVPFLLYFFFNGALSDYIRNTIAGFTANSVVYRLNPFEPLQYIIQPLHINFVYLWPLFFMGFCLLALRIYRQSIRAIIVSHGAVIACMGMYGFLNYAGAFRCLDEPHYQITIQPFLIILFFMLENAFLLFKAKQKASGAQEHAFFGIVVFEIIFSLLFISGMILKNDIVYGFNSGRVIARQTDPKAVFPSVTPGRPLVMERGRGVVLPDWQADEINSVVAYLREKTAPGETVMGFPDLSSYNFLADRPGFSRFYLIDLICLRSDWTREFFSALYNNPPRYILVKTEIEYMEYRIAESPLVNSRNVVRNFVAQNYQREASFGRIDIYRLRDKGIGAGT